MKILTATDTVVTSPPFVAADGYTPAATSSTPTLAVVSDGGQTLTVGAVSAVSGSTGYYQATIQAISNPDLLTLTWTGAVSSADQVLTQRVDVVGGVYLSKPDLWALPDLSKHGMPRLVELRDEFEDIVERWTGIAQVRRYSNERVLYDGTDVLRLRWNHPASFVSVADDDAVTYATTEWTTTVDGFVTTDNVWADVTVKYIHGLTQPPAALVTACKEYVRSKCLQDNSRVARDLLSLSGEAGIERYSTPDWSAGRPTGLLDVDRTIVSLPRRALVG